MARSQALALLVSVLSATAFAPSAWTGGARTAPLRAGVDYLEGMSSAAPKKWSAKAPAKAMTGVAAVQI